MGIPILGPHARFERIRTPNARCITPGLCFRCVSRRNHKKFIRCRKIMKTCTHDGPGDECVWKIFGVHRLSQTRERSTGLTSFISDQCRLHGRCEVACTKRHPNLGCSGHAHLRAPRKGRTNSHTKRTLHHTRSVFSVRFREKTLGNSYGAGKL